MHRPAYVSRALTFSLLLLASVYASACSSAATSTPFIPPAPQSPTSSPTQPAPIPAANTPTALVIPTSTLAPVETATPTSEACTDGLSFVQDLTIPDGSIIQPGAVIEKEWLVQNSGSCNWDASYRLKLVGGEGLGASTEQALYPARAGGQVTLRITFTAPLDAGTYQSAWQAYNPAGAAFGDAIYMTINVIP